MSLRKVHDSNSDDFVSHPNAKAQQRRGPSARRSGESLYAPAVCYSAWFGVPLQPQPRTAASITAMSIFFIVIIASNARLAAAASGPKTALVRVIGEICQDNPHLSLHQPHALSWPPLPTIAFQ